MSHQSHSLLHELSQFTSVIDQHAIAKEPLLVRDALPVILSTLQELSYYYPGFTEWFHNKIHPGLTTGERSILLDLQNGHLRGLAITKNTKNEKKLCCVRVLPPFVGSGIGIKLFERSFQSLGTEKPLISVSEEKEAEFNRIFHYFGFNLTEQYPDLYRAGRYESSFNGTLSLEKKR